MGVYGFRICEICRKTLPTKAAVRQHSLTCIDPRRQLRVRLEHITLEQLFANKISAGQIKELFDISNELKCPICQLQAADLNSFMSHMEVHKTVATVFCSRPEFSNSLAPTVSLLCNFPGCSFTCKLLEKMNQHQYKMHSSRKKFKCQFGGCQLFFCSAHALHRHVKSHKQKKHTCENCGKFLGTSLALKRHMGKHMGRLFRCDVPGCTYITHVKKYVCDHKKNSHNNPGFTCQLCGTFFKTIKHSKRHLQRHESGSPGVLKCTYVKCKQIMFSSAEDLKQHVSIAHTFKIKIEEQAVDDLV
jgi:hypothetical protein